MKYAVVLLLTAALCSADVTGRWSTPGKNIFILRQQGNAVTGTIESGPGEPVFKIVDGIIRGSQIHFFVLHEDEKDPEVIANGGKPFHNFAQGTFTDEEIVVSGSRENTTIRVYRLVLRRIR